MSTYLVREKRKSAEKVDQGSCQHIWSGRRQRERERECKEKFEINMLHCLSLSRITSIYLVREKRKNAEKVDQGSCQHILSGRRERVQRKLIRDHVNISGQGEDRGRERECKEKFEIIMLHCLSLSRITSIYLVRDIPEREKERERECREKVEITMVHC